MSRRAIILAGGKGSRMLPFTITIPKPLVPIGEYPILEILIRQLKRQGFERITISVGHLASLVQSFCGSGERWQIPIDYIFEDQPLGTIGCLGIIPDLTDDRVLVINGDTLTDLQMAETYAQHSTADAITLCAHQRSVEVEFGVLESNDGYLSSYTEKPALTYRVSMGVNVVSTWAIREHIPPGRPLDIPELVRRLLAAGKRVRVREAGCFWLDLGRMKDLEAGQAAFEANPRRFLPD